MKRFTKWLVLSLAFVFLVACGNGEGGGTSESAETAGSGESLDIALLVESTGDMSFNDSAVAGLNAAEEEYGEQISTTVIEYGADPASIEPNFLDTADAGYEVVIMPSQFVDTVSEYAQDYPDVSFWLFDTDFDYDVGDYNNVYSIVYRANEASYLGGYLAASTSDTGVLGFLGGIDNNIIADFLVGYAQGAQAANPDVTITTGYVGAWNDSARGKELSLSMYNQDASMVFNVAGGSGVGLIEAAVERDRQVLGVDSDQAMMYAEQGQEDFAQVIPTSVLKNVGDSLHRAIGLHLNGELQTGATETLGLAENGVGLAENEYYEAAYPEDLRAEVEEIAQQIIAGEIEVDSAYTMSNEEIENLRNEVAP